ncbi:MAG: hypothetical protein ABEH35_08015 [Haloarculaceae archaeon]
MATNCQRSPNDARRDGHTTAGKTRLFCPECGHESGVHGDWRVTLTADGRKLRCPECDAVVVEQPREA